MSLRSIFFPTRAQKIQNAANMFEAAANEWRVIFGLPIASILVPKLMGSPPEEYYVLFAFTLVFIMPSAVVMIVFFKKIRNWLQR